MQWWPDLFVYLLFSEADQKNNKKKKSGEKKLIGVVCAEFNIYMY